MLIAECGGKARTFLQRDVQRDQVSTLPRDCRNRAPLPDLDFDEGEQTWPRAPGYACSDFEVSR